MGCRIAEVPQRDRPRERLGRLGTEALTDAELVALVLRSGGPGISALGLAEYLLADAEGVAGLSEARLGDLGTVNAMGTAKASALIAAFELGRRAATCSDPPPTRIRDAGDIVALARRELTDHSREAVLVIVLNSANRPIKIQRLTVGTDTRCLMDPRDVLRAVVGTGGAAFAVVHNHPSGDPKPSPEDVSCTELLSNAARSVGVHFLDHLIVTNRGWARAGSITRISP